MQQQNHKNLEDGASAAIPLVTYLQNCISTSHGYVSSAQKIGALNLLLARNLAQNCAAMGSQWLEIRTPQQYLSFLAEHFRTDGKMPEYLTLIQQVMQEMQAGMVGALARPGMDGQAASTDGWSNSMASPAMPFFTLLKSSFDQADHSYNQIQEMMRSVFESAQNNGSGSSTARRKTAAH